jgi:hypothetical protein
MKIVPMIIRMASAILNADAYIIFCNLLMIINILGILNKYLIIKELSKLYLKNILIIVKKNISKLENYFSKSKYSVIIFMRSAKNIQ